MSQSILAIDDQPEIHQLIDARPKPEGLHVHHALDAADANMANHNNSLLARPLRSNVCSVRTDHSRTVSTTKRPPLSMDHR